jgi:ACR3 family arsenite efflux pump ArsB
MTETAAQRALTAATVSLAVAVVCIAMFLPPLAEGTMSSVLRIVATAAVLAVAVPLHWVYTGICARRMGRSVVGWTSLSVLLFPIGSAAALILLGWLGEEDMLPVPAPHHG